MPRLLAPLAKIVFHGWRIDVMGWLTAIGTVGAVVVALWFALLDRFRRRKAARWHQAEQLTGWLGFGVVEGPPGPLRGKAYTSGKLVWKPGDNLVWKEGGWEDRSGHFFRAVMIQNASQQVVYSVIVWLVRDHRGRGRGERMAARTMIGEAPPGLTESRIEILDVGTDRPKIEVAFVDASNRSWIRWQDGTLHKPERVVRWRSPRSWVARPTPLEYCGLTDVVGSDWG